MFSPWGMISVLWATVETLPTPFIRFMHRMLYMMAFAFYKEIFHVSLYMELNVIFEYWGFFSSTSILKKGLGSVYE
jgi:hypothetical protein